jgi:hypothetical protein
MILKKLFLSLIVFALASCGDKSDSYKIIEVPKDFCKEGGEKVAKVFSYNICMEDVTIKDQFKQFLKEKERSVYDPEKQEVVKRKLTDAEYEKMIKNMEVQKLQSIIIGLLVENFVKENKIDISSESEEIESFRNTFAKGLGDQAADDASNIFDDDKLEEMAKFFIAKFKVERALYKEYGGAVIFQQMSPFEPIGAYKTLAEEAQEKGELEFYNKEYKSEFWDYFEKAMSSFKYNEEQLKEYDISKPWWKQKRK